nr:glycosyltransferase family 4 protein [Parvularcula maris]
MARETDSFESLPSPWARGPIRLGLLGRFAPQKGIDHAIRAVRGLSGIELVIGGYGPMEDELRTLAEGAPNITFAGKVEDPRSFIGSIDALLMTSRYEAFGLTGLEARAAGRPLIAYEVDGLADQLAAGGGIAVPAGDEAAMRETLERLTADDIERLIPAARCGAHECYDKQVEAWRELLGTCR